MKIKLFFSALMLLIFSKSFCQKQSFKDIYGRFIIKEHRLTSKVYADAVNIAKDSLPTGKWISAQTGKIDSLLPPPPAVPDLAVSDFKRFKHFVVKPEYYIMYNISYNTFDYDTLGSEPRKIIKVNREDLSAESFSTFNFTLRKEQIHKANICNYILEKEYRDIKKIISGYTCFKVILKNPKKPNYTLELYVTEDIKLNYHPVINCNFIIDDYFPLYIKEYHQDYPNDNFMEYSFIKL